MDFTQRISKEATGLTNQELAERVTRAGYRVGHEGVRQWRTGQTKPRSLEAVIALERALGIDDGSLRDALGWQPPRSIGERVDRIEEALRAHGILDEDDEPVPPPRSQRVAAAKQAVSSRRRRSGPARAG